jgi:cell division transport system permease protein
VQFTPKEEATKKFLSALGPESLELLKDPKWSSPIPSSFELRLSEDIPVKARVPALQMWSAKLKGVESIEDVFFGQGWIENFSTFIASARGVLIVIWLLSLSVGLLIVSNCIRLSFWQRRDEIEILELVGATTRFIRLPFLLEGLTLGVMASVISLSLSFAAHAALIHWLGSTWPFWTAIGEIRPMEGWAVGANIVTALIFGLTGAWNCVRRLNTGWSAAVG